MNIPSSNSTTFSKKPTGVRFSERSSLVIFPSPPQSILENIWTHQTSTEKFKSGLAKNAIVMRSAGLDSTIERLACSVATANCSLDENNFAIPAEVRGIEQFISSSILKLIIYRRRRAISAVLEEQEMQRELGIVDSIRLAQVSKKHTEFSRNWAFAIANVEEVS
ncbi:hypothetical protein ACHAXS_007239 [Conticribra weissflogii]